MWYEVGYGTSSDEVWDEAAHFAGGEVFARNGSGVVPWSALCAQIAPHYKREGGRPPHGLELKAGTIVDATLLQVPVSKKNALGERDLEMSSTKKNNRWYQNTFHAACKKHIPMIELRKNYL